MNKSIKYYVNEDGFICDNLIEPIGWKYIYKDFKTRR